MLFKIIPALIIILFYQFNLTGIRSNPPADETQIIIIGTVHVPTYNYDSDTLLSILNKINPNVILVECDTSYMTGDFQLKEDIKYSFPETQAITEYLQTKQAELRPYDIPGRDIFLNDVERKMYERSFLRDVEFLSMKNKLNNNAIGILNKILAMMDISREMANAKSTYINSPEGSRKIDSINYYTYAGFGNLINSVPELLRYRSYWANENNYWENRNNIMLENIFQFAKYFEGKKIVVLCGFAHKNLLKNGLLKKAGNENLMVKEFMEF
ncbi:MAG: hypothetical protein ABI792_05230 [bacterium]